jgi:hypothetical protein
MKLKLSLVAAAALLATVSAQANPIRPDTGNSSLVFVAMDGTTPGPGVAPAQSIMINLGFTMLDFLPALSFPSPPSSPSVYTQGTGFLTAPGTTVVWDFVNNTRTLNGVLDSTPVFYSTPYNTYTAAIQNGSSWGVLAGDTVVGASSATTAANVNVMHTGNPTAAQMAELISSSGPLNAASRVNNFMAANSFNGTNQPGQIGGNVATSGDAFLNQTLLNNFGIPTGYGAMPYLTQGSLNYIQFTRQQANVPVYQLGLIDGLPGVSVDNPIADTALRASFSFDATAGTLTYVMPVPEPGTYAMLLAGLAAVGFAVRRRQQPR